MDVAIFRHYLPGARTRLRHALGARQGREGLYDLVGTADHPAATSAGVGRGLRL